MTSEKLNTEPELANEQAEQPLSQPKMNAEQVALYERIQAFSLDQADAQLPFSQRLARDNGWSLEYAQQVIEEYKKFAFLAVAAEHPVTPSDHVDQAWHLHLSYTRSYWDEFCPQVLQTPLHHGPTLGGQAENEKFDDWYRQTLDSYAAFFDQAPPSNIWPAPEVRFGRDLHFVRVNKQQNWVISKTLIPLGLMLSLTALLVYLLHGRSSWPVTVAICLAFWGVFQFFKGMSNSSRSTGIGGWTGVGCGGCGDAWSWGDFGGGDSGGSDCGGGGCGGCGGGGCGGCGGG